MVFEIGVYQIGAKQGLSVSNKSLVSRIYKELSKLSSKNQRPIWKMRKGHEQTFQQEGCVNGK